MASPDTDAAVVDRARLIARTTMYSYTYVYTQLVALMKREATLDQADILIRAGFSGQFIDYLDGMFRDEAKPTIVHTTGPVIKYIEENFKKEE